MKNATITLTDDLNQKMTELRNNELVIMQANVLLKKFALNKESLLWPNNFIFCMLDPEMNDPTFVTFLKNFFIALRIDKKARTYTINADVFGLSGPDYKIKF